MKNRYQNVSKLSDAKFRLLIKYFCMEMTVLQIAELLKVNRNTASLWVNRIRQRIYEITEQEKFRNAKEIQIDETYFTKSIKASPKFRFPYMEITVIGLINEQGNVYATIVDKPTKKEIFEMIVKGSYPQLFDGTPLSLYYSSYVSTYLERDVKSIVNITNETTFIKFLRVMAARTGQVLNYNDIARDIDVSAPTVKSWTSILETSGLIYLMPPYSGNLSQRAIKTPKMYFMDTGLCCYLNGITNAEIAMDGPINGALFETYVVSEILKSYWHHGERPYIYFYRDTDNNREVDMLIESEGKVWPIEIKLSSSPNLQMAKHFKIIDEKKRGKGAIICTANKFIPMNKDVIVIPVSYI